MSLMSDRQYIKITVSRREAELIDRAVKEGHGTSRADLCKLAVIVYLREQTVPEAI